jgi:adenine-specific DNA glycosylase
MDTNLSEKNKKSPEEKTAKKKSGRSALDVESHRDLLFLMTKRPEGGLLAGQWEFVHLKVNIKHLLEYEPKS